MLEYWESKFMKEGAMWKFEPSDSALIALEMFRFNHLKNILIPGVGYGRNARVFLENGFKVTGIEISESAILLAQENGLNFHIHHGSVCLMPFDDQQFDGIFCYALIHLLNVFQRKRFLKSCFNQLKPGGLMLFTVVSVKANIYGKGKYLSKNRFKLKNGISVFFYDSESIVNEFGNFGLIEYHEIDEPIKFMIGEEPLKCFIITCKKN